MNNTYSLFIVGQLDDLKEVWDIARSVITVDPFAGRGSNLYIEEGRTTLRQGSILNITNSVRHAKRARCTTRLTARQFLSMTSEEQRAVLEEGARRA